MLRDQLTKIHRSFILQKYLEIKYRSGEKHARAFLKGWKQC